MNIAIVGLGDVGLPLAMQLSRPNHSSVRYHELAEWSHCIVDTRNAMAGVSIAPGKVWKA